jgi:hypothetical protein
MTDDDDNGSLVERIWGGILSVLTIEEVAALSALREVDGSRSLFGGVVRLAAAIERQAEQSASATSESEPERELPEQSFDQLEEGVMRTLHRTH